jgi:hypothetical protein
VSDLLASLVQQYIVGDDLISHARPWFPQIEEEEWAELDLEMQRPPRRRAVARCRREAHRRRCARTHSGSSITVIPADGDGRSIAASAVPASSSPMTLPSSRSGRRVPLATSASIGGYSWAAIPCEP